MPSSTDKQLPDIGIHDGIANVEYHRGPGISKSGLDMIHRSPAHFLDNKFHPRPDTAATKVGSAFHALVLEPGVFGELYVKSEHEEFRTKESKQWRAEIGAAGKFILGCKSGADAHRNPSEWDLVHRMRDAIRAHPYASVLLDPDQGKHEQTVYWIDRETKKLCKCRPDFLNTAHNVAVDLKTTADATFSGFAKSVGEYRYQVQAAFYSDGLKAIYRNVDAFIFVAIEKDPPYGIGVYELDREALRVGRLMYQRDLLTYAACHTDNEWPNYPPEIRTLELAPWGLRGKVS